MRDPGTFVGSATLSRIQLAFPLRGTPTPNPSPQGGGGLVGVHRYSQCHSQKNLFAALALFALALAALPAHAVEPGEMLKDPGAGGPGAPHLAGAAVPRVPEPVDRRQQRRACPRPARAGARAPGRRRQRCSRCCASSRPATASSCCCARLKPHTLLLWLAPVLLLAGTAFALIRRARIHRVAATGPGAAPLSPAEQQRLDDLLKKPKP